MKNNTPGCSQREGGDLSTKKKKKTRAKFARGVCLFFLFGAHPPDEHTNNTLPRTSHAGTHDVGPKQYLRESIQEAEEGRLGKLAPFAAGGGHPLRHPLRWVGRNESTPRPGSSSLASPGQRGVPRTRSAKKVQVLGFSRLPCVNGQPVAHRLPCDIASRMFVGRITEVARDLS